MKNSTGLLLAFVFCVIGCEQSTNRLAASASIEAPIANEACSTQEPVKLGGVSGTSELAYCNTPLDLPTALPGTSGMKLTQLQVVTRHGDRVPGWKVPAGQVDWECEPFAHTVRFLDGGVQDVNQEYVAPYFLPPSCYSSQLTSIGRDQHLALGAAVRRKYVACMEFLPARLTTVNLDKFFVRSTDKPRTRQSAQAFLAGLYPEERRDKDLSITLRTRTDKTENLDPNEGACPALNDLLGKGFFSSELAKGILGNPLIPEVGKKLGFDPADKSFIVDTFEGMDNIYARVCHDKPLPEGLTMDEITKMRELQDQAQGGMYSYEEHDGFSGAKAARLGIGTFLEDIRNTLRAAGKPDGNAPRMVLWSGHDITIWPLLATLGLNTAVAVPYASHIAFELWQDSQQQYWVAVEFDNDYQTIPGCDAALCELENFEAAIEKFIPVDFEKECAVSS